MEAQSHLLEEYRLDNGLIVHFYDESRPVAGDRWFVKLTVHIPLEAKEVYFRNLPDPQQAYRAFVSSCGREVAFRYEKSRNFVEEGQVKEVLGALKREFLETNLNYLSRTDFAQRYILRNYSDWKEKEERDKAFSKKMMRGDA